MTIYPDAVVIEYHDGTDWEDISAYVVSDIRGFQGHTTTDPLDRVAGLGTLEFELNNVDELFTPMGGDSVRGLSTLTGFNRGAKIRVRITYADHDRVMFFGRISGISSDDGTWGRRRVSVSCVDWMDIAAKYPTKSSTVLSQQMLGTAMPALIDRVSIQPENRYIDDGIFTFPSVFDNTSEKTKAISEINKLTLSELGYSYILKDGSLVVEDILHRRGTIPLTTIPNIEEVYLLDEGTEILAGASTGTLLTASWDYEEPSLEFTAKKLTIKLNEDDLYNRLQTTCYPIKSDTSLVVIYSLGSPLALGASQTITFTGKYTDPDGVIQ